MRRVRFPSMPALTRGLAAAKNPSVESDGQVGDAAKNKGDKIIMKLFTVTKTGVENVIQSKIRGKKKWEN